MTPKLTPNKELYSLCEWEVFFPKKTTESLTGTFGNLDVIISSEMTNISFGARGKKRVLVSTCKHQLAEEQGNILRFYNTPVETLRFECWKNLVQEITAKRNAMSLRFLEKKEITAKKKLPWYSILRDQKMQCSILASKKQSIYIINIINKGNSFFCL
jgi:hypothetical protein